MYCSKVAIIVSVPCFSFGSALWRKLCHGGLHRLFITQKETVLFTPPHAFKISDPMWKGSRNEKDCKCFTIHTAFKNQHQQNRPRQGFQLYLHNWVVYHLPYCNKKLYSIMLFCVIRRFNRSIQHMDSFYFQSSISSAGQWKKLCF